MAEFGNSDEGVDPMFLSTNTLFGCFFTSPEDAGLVTGLKIYAKDNTTCNVKGVLVLKDTLIIVAVGAEVEVQNVAGWYNSEVSPPVEIDPSTEYVIMFIPEGNLNEWYYSNTIEDCCWYDNTNNYTTPTNPTDAGTTANYLLSAVCTYTPVVSGGAGGEKRSLVLTL